jgi:signal transduction histidine kinase
MTTLQPSDNVPDVMFTAAEPLTTPAADPWQVADQLASQAARLARRNEALEDFVSLVAHELKAPLNAALLQENKQAAVEQAIDLVDTLLEAARAEDAPDSWSVPGQALAGALDDLGPIGAVVVGSCLPIRFPLPAASLRLILRNLVANAVAAGARRVEVSVAPGAADPTLVVGDDGVGLDATEGYAPGSGIGLGLMRRLAGRFGGTVELQPRPGGKGANAIITVPWS